MTHKRILFFLALAMVSLVISFGGGRSAHTQPAQRPTDRGAGSILIGNAAVEAKLQAKGSAALKGRTSFYFEMSQDQLKRGAIAVRQFNLVFPDAPQATISGREPKSRIKTGPLGLSVPASEKSVTLRYDAQKLVLSGEIPVQAHFPQIDEIYPPVFVKDDRESDFAVSRTQRGRVKLEIKLSQTLDKAIASATQKRAARVTGNVSASIEVEALGDLPGYRLELRRDAWIIDVGIWRWFESASRLCIQPVRIRSGAGDATPTGAGLAFGMPGANTQWKKADVVFEVRDWMFINNASLKVATEGAEETTIRGSINVADCIEIFFVENFDPVSLHGGGATWSSGTANAKIISSDGNATFGVDLTHLAHELGHVLNMGHPGNPGGLFNASTNTLMCPSGWHNDNPKRNSRDNALNVSNPLLVWTLKSVTPGPDCNSSADCGACP
ncbi:MAG: hypothetical protein ACRD9S_23975 [Pyrinomonadaceae bacterium]